MSVHQIERMAVSVLGFLGAALAMCIAPGDIFLCVATGIALGLFSRAVFRSTASCRPAAPPWHRLCSGSRQAARCLLPALED